MLTNLFLFIALTGCELIKVKNDGNDTRVPIARAKDAYLYKEELIGIVSLTGEDSVEAVRKHIEDWARKQLLISEARSKLELDEAEIERKVLAYRYSLIGHEYQQSYISENLNMDVSESEITEYYENNKDNFILMQNIVRGRFIKLPSSAPRTDEVKSLIRSNKDEDFEELKSYCLSFASSYQLYDSVWMVFEDMVKGTPMEDVPNKVQFLKNRKFIEDSDENFIYFLQIEEYRISDNVSPIEFVSDQIKSIIINKRMVGLARKLEDDVFKNAKENNEFEIYSN